MPIKHQIRTILTPVPSDDAAKVKLAQRSDSPVRIASDRAAPKMATPDLGDDIARSVQTVERAVENIGALKDNCDYYMNMTAELRRELDQEREDRKDADKALDELDHQARSESARAELAEERLVTAENHMRQLEQELESVRSQTERLVETIALLVAPVNSQSSQDDFGHLAA